MNSGDILFSSPLRPAIELCVAFSGLCQPLHSTGPPPSASKTEADLPTLLP